MQKKLEPHVEATTFPLFVVDDLKPLKINGLHIKDFGGAGLSILEAGSILYEMSKIDGSVSMFFLV